MSWNTIRRYSPYKYLLILHQGNESVHQAMLKQRLAGNNVDAVAHLARELAGSVSDLHHAGLVHFDLKLRNVLVSTHSNDGYEISHESDVVLCDLDTSGAIGSLRLPEDVTGSSGYYAPEIARWVVALREEKPCQLRCETSQDVWSYGAILFELCSGRTLFSVDLLNDTLIHEDEDLMNLCSWQSIDQNRLNTVFKRSKSCSKKRRSQAQHLIRWCLQGDASKRPTFDDIIRHPFFASENSAGSLFYSAMETMKEELKKEELKEEDEDSSSEEDDDNARVMPVQ